ncbi:protein CPR-5-like isoform X1 [Hibiscus syriacus]|uniref:Protein CPR-5-like isoform X1 n=1 Tax=Hibiscus syriacus TaxID=106335 RepID=A0A6A3ARF9_HIBSY|nr:protein CPR-5-like isoform X1 [Hibiscus syriacus]
MREGAKRNAASKKQEDTQVKSSQENQNGNHKPAPKAKRAKTSKPQSEPEYFEDKRNLEDLWKEAFPVGTEWDQLDTVVSPFPPSDKIGINSVQREAEEIVPMKQMKMDWVPHIPLENIFLSAFEGSTEVQIIFPAEPKPVFCEFDWELDELDEFTDKLIEEDELDKDQKDAFKEFVKGKVREAKKANRQAREARKKALEEMSEETKAAFENMRFYKFYPVQTPDTPDVSNVKSFHKQVLREGTRGSLMEVLFRI